MATISWIICNYGDFMNKIIGWFNNFLFFLKKKGDRLRYLICPPWIKKKWKRAFLLTTTPQVKNLFAVFLPTLCWHFVQSLLQFLPPMDLNGMISLSPIVWIWVNLFMCVEVLARISHVSFVMILSLIYKLDKSLP